jgi:alkylation response protein AidB-like acyl-CoA dehydrogenase
VIDHEYGQPKEPAMTTLTDRTAESANAANVIARITSLQPLLRQNAAQGELDRRVVTESIEALRAAGVFRVAQPKRYGGYEASMRTMLDVSSAVGEADGGTAWVVALLNVCAWLTGLFPQAAQDDVWGSNPDSLVSGVLAPSAESRKVEGGHRVSGRWFWNSGSWHANWAVLGLPIMGASGEVVDQGLALISRSDLELEDTWFVAGMKSTGSNCLIARDVFVPDHRIISVPAAIVGNYATEHADEVLYRAAFVPVLALVLVGPQLGLGRAALEIVKSKAATKPISYTFYTAQADSVAFQLQLAEAAMMIDTAHLHAYRAADDIDAAAEQGEYLDLITRARVRADTGWAAAHVVDAINVLLSAHGASSFADANHLQRIWRDSSVAARHAVVLPAVGYEVYGKALLERADQITPLV